MRSAVRADLVFTVASRHVGDVGQEELVPPEVDRAGVGLQAGEVADCWVKIDGLDVSVETETLGGVASRCSHGQDEVRSGTVAGVEDPQPAFGDADVGDEHGVEGYLCPVHEGGEEIVDYGVHVLHETMPVPVLPLRV